MKHATNFLVLPVVGSSSSVLGTLASTNTNHTLVQQPKLIYRYGHVFPMGYNYGRRASISLKQSSLSY